MSNTHRVCLLRYRFAVSFGANFSANSVAVPAARPGFARAAHCGRCVWPASNSVLFEAQLVDEAIRLLRCSNWHAMFSRDLASEFISIWARVNETLQPIWQRLVVEPSPSLSGPTCSMQLIVQVKTQVQTQQIITFVASHVAYCILLHRIRLPTVNEALDSQCKNHTPYACLLLHSKFRTL